MTSSLNSYLTKPIVGLLILAAILLSWLKKGFGVSSSNPLLSKSQCSALGLPLGFYEGFLVLVIVFLPLLPYVKHADLAIRRERVGYSNMLGLQNHHRSTDN